MDSKQLGILGEDTAVKYLKNKGYRILDRNFSEKWQGGVQKGEIDIIAKPRRNVFDILRGKKEGAICFVEVKSSFDAYPERAKRAEGFLPEDRVNFQKQRKLIKMAQFWLSKNKIPLESKWQIDVISIRINPETRKAKILHFKNAVC